jgi:uracil-DNA glycosylase family 4
MPQRKTPDLKVGPTLDQVRADVIRCRRCERLRTYCAQVARDKKAAHRDDVYWGRPVPGFGDPNARVLVLGLAPAAHGANRTGRVFTGDGSGDFLMRAMHAAGFATIATSQRVDDGLALKDAYILSAVRCAPPDNKPTPGEIAACHSHLIAETSALPHLRVIVALGKIGFDAAWRLLAARGIVVKPKPVFGHGVVYHTSGPTVIASYHPSRQNTNTRKLTPPMLDQVFRMAAALSGRRSPPALIHATAVGLDSTHGASEHRFSGNADPGSRASG